MDQDELMLALQGQRQEQEQPPAEQQTAEAAAAEQNAEGMTPAVKARIEELSRRNVELEKLVNMGRKVDEVSSAQEQQAQWMAQQQQILLAQQRAANPQAQEEQNWSGWLAPKVAPLVMPEFQKRDAKTAQLEDQVDRLQVSMQFPEYGKDPELQAQVEQIRRERAKLSGIVFSRSDILTYLRGMNVDTIAKQKAEEILKEQAEAAKPRNSMAFTENGVPVSSSRPADMPNKPLESWTLEEMENFFQKHPEYAVIR